MIKVGFIGAGGVSRNHRESVTEIDGAELAAVFDLNRQSSRKFAEVSGAEDCESADEVIEKSDAVYILTPPHTHKELPLQCPGCRQARDVREAVGGQPGRRTRDRRSGTKVVSPFYDRVLHAVSRQLSPDA